MATLRRDTEAFDLADREQVMIGRSKGCDLVIDDLRVSRLHAIVERLGDRHFVRDAGSANGTMLNGHRLSPHSSMGLRPGDAIEVGSTTLVYASEDVIAAPPPSGSSPRSPLLTTFSLAELARELPDGDPRAIEEQARILKSLAGGPLVRALEDVCAIACERTGARAAAVFSTSGRHGVQLAAARPAAAAGPLRAAAEPPLKAGVAALLREVVPPTGEPGQTLVETACMIAVVPFAQRGSIIGALAIRRQGRIEREHVVLLAATGERLARALSIRGKGLEGTAFGTGRTPVPVSR